MTKNQLSPQNITNNYKSQTSLGLRTELNTKLRQRQRQSLQPQVVSFNDQSFQPQSSSNLFYKKEQIPQKKSFNDYLTVIPREDFNTQHTSIDSLVQVCSIIPDPKLKQPTHPLLIKLSQTQKKTQHVTTSQNNNQPIKSNLLSSYLTSNTDFRTSTIVPLTSRQKESNQQIFNDASNTPKDSFRKSFQGNYSHRDHLTKRNENMPTFGSSEKKKTTLNQFKSKSKNCEGDENHRVEMLQSHDLTKHLDLFLSQNNHETIKTQSIHEVFTSFAANIESNRNHNTLQPSQAINHITQLSKDKLFQLQQQFSSGGSGPGPNCFPQSPTPKFSLQFEKGHLKDALKHSNDKANKRWSHFPPGKETKFFDLNQTNDSSQQSDLLSLQKFSSDKKPKHLKGHDFGRDVSPTQFKLPVKDIKPNHQPQKRHMKSTNGKSYKHYSSRMQKKSSCFQTLQENEQRYFANQAFEKNTQDDRLIMMADTMKSPMSDRSPSDPNKQHILYRTVSMDHYLSNGTTFLKGQRFLSPSSQQQQLNKSQNNEGGFPRQQVGFYLANMIFKKFTQASLRILKASFDEIKAQKLPKIQTIAQKFDILNLIKEFLLKQQACDLWKRSLVSLPFKRKGYALGILTDKLSKVYFQQSFNALRSYNFDSNPCDKELLLQSKYSLTLKQQSFKIWYNGYHFRKLAYRRAIIVSRQLSNIMVKRPLHQAFNQIKAFPENQLNNEKLSSLNLNIKEFLQQSLIMASSLTCQEAQRYSKDKLLRFMGLSVLSQQMKTLQLKNQGQFLCQLKRFCDEKKRENQIMEIQQRSKEEKDEYERRLKFQSQKLKLNAGLLLAQRLKKSLLQVKVSAFTCITSNFKQTQSLNTLSHAFLKYDERSSTIQSFYKWKDFSVLQGMKTQKIVYIQTQVLQKAFHNRQRLALNQWRKFAFQTNQVSQAQIERLKNYFKLISAPEKLKRRYLQKWLQTVKNGDKLFRLVQIMERQCYTRYTRSFNQLKVFYLTKISQQAMRLPSLIVQKALKRDQYLINRSFQTLKNHLQVHLSNQRQSQSLLAATSLGRVLARVHTQILSSGLVSIKQHSRAKKNQQTFFNQTLSNSLDLLSDLLRQRYYQTMQKLKQNSILKTHQRQILAKLLLKMRFKYIQMGYKRWERQGQALMSYGVIEQLKSTQRLSLLKSLLIRSNQKYLFKSFGSWQCETKNQQVQTKVEGAIRTMAGATKIFDLFSLYSLPRQAFNKWLQASESLDQHQLGLQMLTNLYKKKLKLTLRTMKHQVKRKKAQRKHNLYKAQILAKLLDKMLQARQSLALRNLISHSLLLKTDQEKRKLAQKKNEIHNQIVLLSEKDTKLRKQEAFLLMKEQRIADQEKDVRDKQKRLAEISKGCKDKTRQHSKSPSNSSSNSQIKPQTMNKQASIKTFANIKNQEYQSVGQQQAKVQAVMSGASGKGDKLTGRRADNMPFQKTTIDLRKAPSQLSSFNSNSFQQSLQPQTTLNKENKLLKSSQISLIGDSKKSYNQVLQSSTSMSMSSSLAHPHRHSTQGQGNNLDQMHSKLLRVAAERLVDKLQRVLYNNHMSHAFSALKQTLQSERRAEGAQVLVEFVKRKLLSEALIQWLKSVYCEELMIQESIEVIRERKLLRALMIVERSATKDEVLLLKAFKEWKRMEYQMVLEGLKKYSQTLERNAHSSINSARSITSQGGFQAKFFK